MAGLQSADDATPCRLETDETPQSLNTCLHAAREGSTEALGKLMEASQNYLLLVANREINGELRAKGGASDLVQDTFLEAKRDFVHFEGNSEAEFRGWLRRLLLNNVSNFARRYRSTGKRSLRREIAIEPRDDSVNPYPLASAGPSPIQSLVESEEQQQLLHAMREIPSHYREVILLRHRDGLTYQEIGERLQRSPEAVRKLWARGIELLQTRLDPQPAVSG